ncbi:MAG: ABC transporter permease, partial [Patescibacteria group bacterium]|nr:ABC transporter permease [Patescibacteria group bacterium]
MSRFQLLRVLLIQEIRTLLVSPALWGMLVILSLLVGYSFIQAVELFSQASETALSYSELASGMNPLEGIFVPTFGAYYLVETLLLPFVVIRLIGQDKQNGTLKLLLQLPLSPFSLNCIKLSAMAVVWLLILLPGVSVLIIWYFLGGAVHLPEILTLLSGHSFYALTIVCIAMFATVITNTMPTAAMICLATTLGSWVLDFAAGEGGWIGVLGNWSLTTLLRQFESGLLSSDAFVSFLALSLLFFSAASVLLHPGRKLYQKIKPLLGAVVALLVVVSSIMQVPQYRDVTENRKHSFNPANARALQQMNEPLKITIHLAPEDGRLYDLEHEVLTKLRRTVSNLEVVFANTQSAGLFAASEDDNYGMIEYEYAGKHDQSYSNSIFEILPLLHALAGHKVIQDAMPSYSGHPLVADASGSKWWFYLLLPLIFLLGAYLFRQPQL